MYSKNELKAMDKIAKEWHGRSIEDLNSEEQDEIYCYCEDNGLIEWKHDGNRWYH